MTTDVALLNLRPRPHKEKGMHQPTSVQMTIRVPISTVDRLDTLADMAGLTRAQAVRMLLCRASEADLPTGLIENADRLREARGAE
jgi:hypothetical protein